MPWAAILGRSVWRYEPRPRPTPARLHCRRLLATPGAAHASVRFGPALGSALRDDFDPTRSDLDLLVEFQPIDSGSLVQAFFSLERQLASITGMPVDLVMADAVRNPYVRRDIEASKQLIYEA
jgi:predicted nucleotidyltransferase